MKTCLRLLALALGLAAGVTAGESLTVAGPAMGTTYRVTLARLIAGSSLGEIHREIDQLLARIDLQLSNWRPDSDVARLNRAAAGVWTDVGSDLVAVLAISEQLTQKTGGRFDVTVAPLVRWWKTAEASPAVAGPPAELQRAVGFDLLQWRRATDGQPAAVRKRRDGVEVDLGGIGPGYAVDRIGETLAALGSTGHLVELGGEVRAWGCTAAGTPWRVGVQIAASAGGYTTIQLADGEAVAVFRTDAGQTVVDPRTGRPPAGATAKTGLVHAASCAEADALATAAVLPESADHPTAVDQRLSAAASEGP